MTSDQRFTLLITGLTLIFTVMAALLGVGIRAVVKFTRAEAHISELAEDMKQLVKDKDAVHTSMYEQMRDDRAATDKRLRWLEENVWKGKGGRKGAI